MNECVSEGLDLFCLCVKVECLCGFTEFFTEMGLGRFIFQAFSASIIWNLIRNEFLKVCNTSLTMDNIVSLIHVVQKLSFLILCSNSSLTSYIYHFYK